MAMNPEVKAQWVKALRSGEYKQGLGRLRIGEQFCCLGVLCDLYAKEVGGSWCDAPHGLIKDAQRFEVPHAVGSSLGLPEPVAKWAGFSEPVVLVRAEEKAEAVSIDVLNDGGVSVTKRTFLEIADVIEVQL